MIKLEESKYMQPHFSYIVKELMVEIQPVMNRTKKEEVQVHFDADAHEEPAHQIRINTMQQMVKEF